MPSIMMRFWPLVATCLVVVPLGVRSAAAQDISTKTRPSGGSGSSGNYWTPERMRQAKPMMPTVPGKPKDGSALSAPTGPGHGAPGHAPRGNNPVQAQ